jgi:hypothetical protein
MAAAGLEYLPSCCALVMQLSDAGTAWLAWLWQLTELRLQHCGGITDAGEKAAAAAAAAWSKRDAQWMSCILSPGA